MKMSGGRVNPTELTANRREPHAARVWTSRPDRLARPVSFVAFVPQAELEDVGNADGRDVKRGGDEEERRGKEGVLRRWRWVESGWSGRFNVNVD